MRYSAYLIVTLLCCSFASVDELGIIRTYFEKATSDKTYAEKLKLNTDGHAKAIMKAYNGVAWSLLAKHHKNPYKKLEYLKTGLGIINSAVLLDASDLEIRFLRFSIEENIPSIVSFTSHIQSDKKMILENLNSSHAYYHTIKMYMKKSKNLTESEKSKLP